ncbi:hypothetical protein HN371_15470 [Candidatus Poribacteria bacterium]|nr:hypothetical protein [Candidatus Poribacteria bacterium]MBT5535520.1 hypothetical protein [Candidatus Poribacteria bacterium]MBT5711007.1 hypothetical protein [Candidatus Poribacteria bacterium]MBT7097404.1 hypothetical protein [Candidatus Poribacteria bacterium]MBT7803954.1 hypothetical protein [Candidatus Poribacteria bacterium]
MKKAHDPGRAQLGATDPNQCRSRAARMLSCIAAVTAAAFLLAGARLLAADVEVGGYVKQFVTALDDPASTGPLDGLAATRVRVRALWRPREGVATELAYGVSPRVQAAARDEDVTATRPGGGVYRAIDAPELMYPSDSRAAGTFSLTHNIDRAWVEWSAGSADVSVGRQTVAFGSARFVNPTDVLAPYSYTALDKEERPGVDAVRVRYALGAFSELDAGAVFGDDFAPDASAYFVRAQSYVAETDVSALAMRFRRHALLGIDVARTVGGAGTWLEAAYTFTESVEADDYARLSAGLDYSPAQMVYTFAEYHLNTSGANRADGYASLAGTPAYVDGAAYLLGRHYAAVGASLATNPLVAGGLQVIVNLIDGSALLAPSVEYSFAEDVYLAAGAFVGIGPAADTAEAEFAAYADTLYGTIRLYF